MNSGNKNINISNIFCTQNLNYFNTSCNIEEETQPLPKIILENINGDFIAGNKISIDPHGLNVLKSINKDGSYYFGPKLKEVKFKNFYFN